MDPFLEQKLKDEVLFLHSLWHQGPPTSNPNSNVTNNPIIPIFNPSPYVTNNPIIPIFNPNPNPNINSNFYPYPYVSRHLQPSKPPTQFNIEKQLKPSNSTPFKKEKKRRRDKRGGISRGKNWAPGSDRPPVLDFKWPCDPDLPDTRCGWPTLDLKPAPTTRVATAEEQSRIFTTRLQQKALKAAQELFANNMDSDGDDNDDYGEVDDDIMDDDECDEYKFFLKILMEDSELRSYYEKNYESGEFCCLVCGGIGQKVGKRFKNCVALVQHSVTIAKTKKRQAHRAFGQAICKVLGWDIDKLPTIVLPKLGDLQGNAPDGPAHGTEDLNICNSVNVDNSELVLNKNDNSGEVLPDNAGEVLSDKAVDLSYVVGGELMVCEHSLMVSNGNKNMDDPEKGVPSNVEGNEEGVVNCLEPYKEDGVGNAGDEVKDDHSDNVTADLQRAN